MSTNTGIVDKFNALYGCEPAMAASDSKAQVKEKAEPKAEDKGDKSDKKGNPMNMLKGKK